MTPADHHAAHTRIGIASRPDCPVCNGSAAREAERIAEAEAAAEREREAERPFRHRGPSTAARLRKIRRARKERARMKKGGEA